MAAVRVPLLEESQLLPTSRPGWDRVKSVRGGIMGNVFRALANSPGALETVAGVGEHVRFHSQLDSSLRELVVLCVAKETGCVYEWVHHLPLAKRVLQPGLVEALDAGEAESAFGNDGAAVALVRAMVLGEDVDEQVPIALRQRLGADGLVDLVVTIGYYLLLSRVIQALHVPVDVDQLQSEVDKTS